MKNSLLSLLIVLFFYNYSFAQELILHEDFPDVIWGFLWDMEQDAEENLYVCSELGVLYIKSEGEWEEYDLDPDSYAEARSIAIDQDGVVWIATAEGLFSFSNGEVLEHFTSANSNLPSDDLVEIRAYNNQLWINLNGNGIALKQGDTFTHFTESNSSLESDFTRDIEISESGLVVIGSTRGVHFVSGNSWLNYDFNDMFGSETWISDIFIDHNQDVWFATQTGLIKYDSSMSQFENLKPTYGERAYSAVIYTPTNELWLGELFEGLHYHDQQGNSLFFEGNLEGQPTQVFDFMYYQDTLRVIGNIGSTVTGLTIDFPISIVGNHKHQLSFYPNPANNFLRLDVKEIANYSLVIRSLNGQVLYEAQNIEEIDLSGFSEGNYYLEFIDLKNNTSSIGKIVILR